MPLIAVKAPLVPHPIATLNLALIQSNGRTVSIQFSPTNLASCEQWSIYASEQLKNDVFIITFEDARRPIVPVDFKCQQSEIKHTVSWPTAWQTNVREHTLVVNLRNQSHMLRAIPQADGTYRLKASTPVYSQRQQPWLLRVSEDSSIQSTQEEIDEFMSTSTTFKKGH